MLAAQALLIFNPGYLSHDELQWGYYAQQISGGFFSNGLWGDLHAFQYRPLTFSLWIELSRRLFEHPYAFHAILVGWGAINAGLLAVLMRRSGASVAVAWLAALVFALGPYAAHTHGWVATIADLIWVSCALLIASLLKSGVRLAFALPVMFALCAMALLAKESAIVIPALIALGWWFSGREKRWGWAFVATAAPVAIYLALRLNSILFAGGNTGSIYQWSVMNIPARWFEYQVFPMLTGRLGAGDFLAKGLANRAIIVAMAWWLLLAWSLGRAGGRWLAAFLLGGVVALGPVLVLADAANHYGYGFAAVTAAVCALAWKRLAVTGRVIVVLIGAMCVWHGVNIIRSMHDIGVKQAHFSPQLAEAVASNPSPVRLRPENERDRWIYIRLTHDIPAYRGVPIGDRVQLVPQGESADYLIRNDGSLQRTNH
ncbi:hypothetical protein [Dyella japonica]|uniref:hypothetical protein n=1 Tax=Dyella japonica TaxID=231455 RepID=UPI00130D654D|nr:hypothetical protein [Dyella japonica]